MIPRDAAKALVASFSGNPGYPKTREGLTILINAFERMSDDLHHGKQIADELRIENDYCPTEAGIRRVATATRRERPVGCEKCGGTGWLHGKVKTTVRGVEHVVDAATECECRPRAPRLDAPMDRKSIAAGDWAEETERRLGDDELQAGRET